MVIFAVGFIVSLIPSIALYFWFKGLKSDQLYKESCKKAFINGLIAVFPVILLSAIFALLKNLLFANVNPLLYAAVHCFIVLALAEELAKYFMGRKTIDKMINSVSWLDQIIFMGIVGIGFGIAEDIPYAIESSPLAMLIRGFTIGHGVYGMMTGYFLGKIMKDGKSGRWQGLLAIVPAWLIHGLYDFGLSQEIEVLGDWTAIISVSLAVFELIMLIVFILFIRKARNDEKYTAPLLAAVAGGGTVAADAGAGAVAGAIVTDAAESAKTISESQCGRFA